MNCRSCGVLITRKNAVQLRRKNSNGDIYHERQPICTSCQRANAKEFKELYKSVSQRPYVNWGNGYRKETGSAYIKWVEQNISID